MKQEVKEETEWKGNLQNRRTYANHVFDKDLISIIYKKLL